MSIAWAVLWVGAAIFQALPGQNTGTAVAGAIGGGDPGWLGRLDASVAGWVVAQDVGQLYSGQATDPNTALIIALPAIATLGARRAHVGSRVRARGMYRAGRAARRDLGEGSAARP